MKNNVPVIVPFTTVPFFSSIETVSLFSFIKNLRTPNSVIVIFSQTVSNVKHEEVNRKSNMKSSLGSRKNGKGEIPDELHG